MLSLVLRPTTACSTFYAKLIELYPLKISLMSHGNVIVRFDEVSFAYNEKKPILDEASFSVRQDSKITIMGQNGAGKSTLFKLLVGAVEAPGELTADMILKPTRGTIHIQKGATVGIGLQVLPKAFLNHSMREYFATAFTDVPHHLDKLIADVLDVVDFNAPLDQKMSTFSGGQLARLLLAHALIQEPDLLLLDEPTNNLDQDGIDHLTGFLIMYPKTVIVISHDADFLNSFTEGVLNVDVHTQKIEQYVGDYFDVIKQISSQIQREERKNAQLKKNIQDRKDKVNFFSNKGGKMRRLASKMREEVAQDEEDMVEVKRDDKTLPPFKLVAQDWSDPVLEIDKVGFFKNGAMQHKPYELKLYRQSRLLISGPNGIGKSTFLRQLAMGEAEGARLTPGVKVGYYQQDFGGLDFEQTMYDSLVEVMETTRDQEVYEAVGRFLLPKNMIQQPVGLLSEGQKGLLCYARFLLQKPGLLILDEPTNHINFRHLPVIAKALDDFEGAIIMVSHMPEFVEQIRFDEALVLGS